MHEVTVKQISSLEKVRSSEDIKNEINNVKLFLGERFSYQVVLQVEGCVVTEVQVDSKLFDYVHIYSVNDMIMDLPLYGDRCDDDYLTDKPGLMPDMLVPIKGQASRQLFSNGMKTFWVEICIPQNFNLGKYDVTLTFTTMPSLEKTPVIKTKVSLDVEIVNGKLPKQELLFTQWFHVDCLASVYNVEIYSEKHWELIDKYIKTAAELGINMLLTPVITPPLDTEVGKTRPNTQLVKITKDNDRYSFDFSLLEHWIKLCQTNGIEHFEISHLFTQWGAGFAPNIYVYENGELIHEFGWHIKADDNRYLKFLEQFLPCLVEFLKSKGVVKNCFFHISDEPYEKHLDAYRQAYEFIKPLIAECKLMDALSKYDFYKNGLVEIPVCATNCIGPFIENNVDNLWAYYCCSQNKDVGNRFMAMPSYRNRILGLQLYKYNIKGFLQWGYNFYYSQYSMYEINPYATSSASGAFPSGDAFSVYPGKDGPLKSLRAIVFYEALQDILICRMLEKYIGRKAVIEMIDREAGMEITFAQYPRNSSFIPELIKKMKEIITSQLT